MNVAARGRAGAKAILLGEHAVVYGRPALATGLPLSIEAVATSGPGPVLVGSEKDPRGAVLVTRAARAVGLEPADWVVRVDSGIPAGRGLGSSAALAVAVLRALAVAAEHTLTVADELRLGRDLETIFHGTPSGIDPAAAALGRCFRFVAGEPPEVAPVAVTRPVPLVIAYDDTPRSTGAAVAALRARWESDRRRYDALFDRVAALVDDGARALATGDLASLGRAFDENQVQLEALGVSTPELATRIAAARAAGALGAKLTGGGAGGAIIALAVDAAPVAAALRAAGTHVLDVQVG